MNAIDKLAADALFIGQCSRCQFPACLLRPHLVLTLAFDAEIEVAGPLVPAFAAMFRSRRLIDLSVPVEDYSINVGGPLRESMPFSISRAIAATSRSRGSPNAPPVELVILRISPCPSSSTEILPTDRSSGRPGLTTALPRRPISPLEAPRREHKPVQVSDRYDRAI